MSQNVIALQPGAAPAKASAAAGKAASASSGSEGTRFMDRLGDLDAACPDDAPCAAAAVPLQGEAEDEDTPGRLEDLLAMLPASPFPRRSPPAVATGGVPMSVDVLRSPDAAPDSGAGSRGLAGTRPAVDVGELPLLSQPRLPDVLQEPAIGLSVPGSAEAEPGQPARAHSALDPVLARPLHQGVGSAAWAEEIATRVNLMAERGRHTASLRLSPEHLGPLEVRISINDDQASVWFGAAHAETRAALEAALPRLREMFSAQGLSLADSGVFHDAPRQQAPMVARHHYPSAAQAQAQEQSAAISIPVRMRPGLLDLYA